MNRWIRFAAAGLVLAVAACDGTSGSPLAPEAARFDSGPIVGGNSTGPDPVATGAASDTTEAARSGPIVGGN